VKLDFKKTKKWCGWCGNGVEMVWKFEANLKKVVWKW
jgi:hypothetical protein